MSIPVNEEHMQDKLQEYRYYSKILLTFTIIMIGMILIFFMHHSYQQNLKNAEKHELDKLQSIAKTIAINIDGDVHEKLICAFSEKDAIKTNIENKTYQKFHQLLKKTQELNNLETPIYTLFRSSVCGSRENNSDNFLFGISSVNPFFRHTYNSFPESLENSFNEGGMVGEYYDDHGHWLSAFFPIKNSEKKTIAVVQVDTSFCTFVVEARTQLMNDSIYALLFLSLITGIFVYVYNLILNSMSKINVTLEEAVSRRTLELHENNIKMKKLNEKLESVVVHRTKELEISNEKLKSFARVASHDLQAPLRLISSFAQLFKRRYKTVVDETGNEYLKYITENTQKMSELIKDILATSLTSKENANDIKLVDLNEVMKDVITNLKVDISKYQANIDYSFLPQIKGFSSEFIQLFQNFISNSIKYSRPDVPPKVKITSERMDGSFLIKISDNGKGISEEALKSIFIEFNRGDATDDEGYGIGLATCRRIINEYDGAMDVSSKVGVGTIFEIVLKNRKSEISSFENSVEASMGEALRN